MAEQVIAATEALFNSENSTHKNEADKWLEQWQQSTDAWSISDSILHNAASPGTAVYFCAQTLKTKVQRDFEELPPAAIPQLRDSLFSLLIKFAKGPPPVRTQLCLALAALAAHIPAEQWGPEGVLRWFLERFSSQPQDIALSCMMEILTVLPQEVDSRRISCRPERRHQFAAELRAYVPHAFDILKSCLAGHGEHLRCQTLEAFGCWLRLTEGGGLPADLPSSPLVAAALEGLECEPTFHAATDAVSELIWVTVDPKTCEPNPALQSLAQSIVLRVMALGQRFRLVVHRAIAESEGRDPGDDVDDEFDDDFDTVKGMGRLFCEVGEAYIQLILSATPEVLPPVEALLEVVAHPDGEIHSMAFPFWHKLGRQLLTSFETAAPGAPEPPDATAAAAARSEQLRRQQFFSPSFERLLNLMRNKMRMPSDYADMSNSGKRNWKQERLVCVDVLRDAAAVLGSTRALAILIQPLLELNNAPTFDWRTAELALHCVRSVRSTKGMTSEAQVETLLAMLPSLPRQYPYLQYTAALVMSCYTDVLAQRIAAGRCAELLPRLLDWLVAVLRIEISAAAAALALRYMCEDCGQYMQPCLPNLMALYTQALAADAKGDHHASNGHAAAAGGGGGGLALEEEDVQMVMHAVCLCVCRCVPVGDMVAAVHALVTPVLQPLSAAMTAFSPTLTAGDTSLSGQLYLVDRLAKLFQSMEQQAVVAEILNRSFPALDAALNRAGSNSAAVERLCRTLRHGIKAAGKSGAGLLPALLESLPQRFQQTHHSAFLYVVSELVKIFCDEQAADVMMGPILARMIAIACSGLNNMQAVDAAPDLVDDTFLLAARAVAYCPRMILTPQILPILLDTAMFGALIQHREACCSTLSFITRVSDLAAAAPSSPRLDAAASILLEEQLNTKGPQLLNLLLAGCAGTLPSSRIPDIGEALSALLRSRGAAASQWLTAAVASLPEVAVLPGDKEVFLAKANVMAMNAGMETQQPEFQDALDAISDLCRRNKRARVAAQQALLPVGLHSLIA